MGRSIKRLGSFSGCIAPGRRSYKIKHRAEAALPLNQAQRLDGEWELRPRSDGAVDQAAGADQQ
jgi:hypothetical protein